MVMELKDGSLRQYLNNNFISMDWKEKLNRLWCIASGLKNIHNQGLIHRDFHCGNILSRFSNIGSSFITDLGLCQPVNVKSSQNSNKKIYGVLPYVAPEVLKGKEYTQASDIYGFEIIAYEICTGFPPYYDIAHDEFLAMKIYPLKRPNADELDEKMKKLIKSHLQQFNYH
ncbi:kinase-like domain-containing protein [Rhizophagus diaphanus]|nr:kinase-like domain-containing protein [Rhizophagus diaphanus] [Rhizophagus sp. MUCL 43196]